VPAPPVAEEHDVNEDGIEVTPDEVDMRSDELDRARELLAELNDSGRYPAIQVCVRRHGKIVFHEAVGRFRPIEGRGWYATDLDTRFMLFSISKCVAATCMHILFDRGVVHVDDPVSWYIPEFGQYGKQHVTMRHLLCHQAGIPMILWNLSDDVIRDWDGVIETICEQRPWHVPGRRTGYHMISGGYILGEVLQRVTGQSLREFLRVEVREKLGLETFDFGIDPEWYDRTACSEAVDRLPPKFLMRFLSNILDVDLAQALAVMNRPAVFEAVIPSGNVTGTAEECSRFFQMLLDGGVYDGVRILSEDQVNRATLEQVMATTDWTLLLTPQRYGLGFMLGRKRTELNIFGKGTEQTFGHLGFLRNLGWADRENDVAGAFLTSGKPVRPGREVLILREFQNCIRRACA
jgi:CubicO group peptidase (beta-lactamase class C family)